MIRARRRWRRALAFLGAFVLLASCGRVGDDPQAVGPRSGPSPTEERGVDHQIQAPPPVTIRFDGQSLELKPFTYCYATACVDGIPGDLVDIGSPSEVIVEFPLEGWTFDASFTPAGDECGRLHAVDLQAVDDGTFVLRPAGHADTYDIHLSGWGDGDLFVAFRWTTPTDGPLAEPEARLAVLADHDGAVDSYGVELMLINLAADPKDAKATITVREAAGESVTFEATRAKGSCWAEGTVYWDGPDRRGLDAAALGDGPFTYEVEVTLDGVSHTATATWPDDEIPDNEPSVALEFTPPLPALT